MTKRALEKADSKAAGEMRFVSFGRSLSDNRGISNCLFLLFFFVLSTQKETKFYSNKISKVNTWPVYINAVL